MKSFFFMDVDTQRDFMLPGGALYVPGAERLMQKLRRIFDFSRKNGITILSTADAHAADDTEFREFPPHCVLGTEGQRKLDETTLPRALIVENRIIDRNIVELIQKHQQIIIQKNALDAFTNPMLERFVRALPQRAVVFGVTTEYCVRLACLGLRSRGIKTVLLSDAVTAIDPAAGQAAIEAMQQAGVDCVTVDTLLSAPSGL
ncbi:MAG: cysteine hydrolase [Acidobacteria bacterium]|nr:cysteine hydrolase [Acidobacteriota bacterium]